MQRRGRAVDALACDGQSRIMRAMRPLWLAWLVLSTCFAGACQRSPTLPNLLLVVADDLGWNDVGYHQSEIRTPTLDALAAGGVRFEQMYAQPLCSATRAALLTGRYPMRMGLQMGVVRPWARHGLPLLERTLPAALVERGYRTALVGKWHLGMGELAYLPTRRGFDHHYGHYGGAVDYFSHRLFGGLDWHRDEAPDPAPGYTTELLADDAIRWLAEDRSRPFFLYVAFNAPHTPLQVPAAYEAPYAAIEDPTRRRYAGVVTAMDAAIGRIVASLRADGRLANTLIAFTSDNGGTPRHGGSNTPWRGAKSEPYEGGIRVPAFLSWPAGLPRTGSVAEPLHVIDFYPTLLRRAGASLEQPLPVDGRDLWPLLEVGTHPLHVELLLDLTHYGRGALRRGRWKLITQHMGRSDERSELYDLDSDPGERRDLAGERPEVVRTLRARLEAYAAQAATARVSSDAMPPDFPVPAIWGPSPAPADGR